MTLTVEYQGRRVLYSSEFVQSHVSLSNLRTPEPLLIKINTVGKYSRERLTRHFPHL